MTDEPKGNLMCGVCGKLYGNGDGHDHIMTDELDDVLFAFTKEFVNKPSIKAKEDAKQALEALIHRHQNQLLDKLLEEAYTLQRKEPDGWTENKPFTKQVIPVEAINKLRSK